VGNAVYRNKAKRVLRAIVLKHENKLSIGKYIFVAKNEIFKRDFKTLNDDFRYALKKLNKLK
jgi:ribonuclease P protein component